VIRATVAPLAIALDNALTNWSERYNEAMRGYSEEHKK
jgi:hypothetical protein